MLKTYKINNYSQILKLKKDKIIDCLCTCKWGTLYSNNYKEGKILCKHIRQVLKDLKKSLKTSKSYKEYASRNISKNKRMEEESR